MNSTLKTSLFLLVALIGLWMTFNDKPIGLIPFIIGFFAAFVNNFEEEYQEKLKRNKIR